VKAASKEPCGLKGELLHFSHEGLDVYKLATEIARWFAVTRFPRGDADLKDQGLRAARSIVLNIAEGRARGGRAEQNHYRIARGSAAECCAVLDLVAFTDAPSQQHKLRRIGAMLGRMA